MQVIVQANETALKILKNFKKTDTQNRMLHYCVAESVEEGVLLFNLMTREMVLLSQEEYDGRLENAYLKDRWFVVPENTNEKAYVDFIRSFLKRQEKNDGTITGYTIFTTTDCNARCFYCFELGRSRIPMSQETALKVVQYIKNHCGGKKVTLGWFGGEPLYNDSVIDVICDGLRREGIEYKSHMVSNGYLFDEAVIKRATESWNLQRVQITLDGTEKVYNKIKAYIYKNVNPYQTVMDNIEKLLDAQIYVSIRLNMDLSNAEDLVELVEELAQRFGGRKNLSVYAHHLFKEGETLANSYSAEEWIEREMAMSRLEEKIKQGSLEAKAGINNNIKLNHCMADSGRHVTILPDGSLGLCEHHTENEFIGHIDREDLDANVIASWKERVDQIPECTECFDYPQCIMLRKCSSNNVCYLQYRQRRKRNTGRHMINKFKQWKKQQEEETTEEQFC